MPEPADLPYLTNVPKISLDTENSGKNPFHDYVCGVSIAWRDEMLNLKTIYAPVGHLEGNMDPDVVKGWLQYVLPGKEVVLQNGKYDIQILRTGLTKKFGIDLEALGCKVKDTAFPDALLDDNRRAGRSLKALTERYLGKKEGWWGDIDKNQMPSYPSWMVAPGAMEDAANTLEIDEVCQPMLEEQGLERVLELENSLIYPVCEIERNGCRIDVEKLERWRKEVRDEYEKIILALHKQTGMMIQPGSGESMMRLFKQLGIEAPVKKVQKKKGQSRQAFEAEQKLSEGKPEEKEKLRAYEIEELEELKHPVINEVIKARQLDSLLSKFLDKYHDGLDGDILRSQFHQLKSDEGGTIGGRFSSSGGGDLRSGYGFNSQQVIKPKLQRDTLGNRWIIRELFVADNDDEEYLSADLSQIEYRLAAHFADAKSVIEGYQKGEDFHQKTQDRIKGYKPDFNDRTITKNVNFAYTFGSSEETLARTAGIPRKEAGELLAIMQREVPEFPILLKRLASQAEKQGFVQTLYGSGTSIGW